MADESIKVPIDGDTNALAHNGVLYNGREFRREQHLPPTPIENEPFIVYGDKKYTEYKISQMQRGAEGCARCGRKETIDN